MGKVAPENPCRSQAGLEQQVLHRDLVGTLNLHRLKKLVVLEERGVPPADFDAARWESSSFGIFAGGKSTHYRFRFDRVVAPYIRERVWHPSQRLQELKRRRVELDFTCGASLEVTAWVASWRTHVEALAPAGLREELRRLSSWMASTYGARRRG